MKVVIVGGVTQGVDHGRGISSRELARLIPLGTAMDKSGGAQPYPPPTVPADYGALAGSRAAEALVHDSFYLEK